MSGDASLDVLFRNARVFDGNGGPWFRADVGVRGDAIARVESLADRDSDLVIDCAGMAVASGFIDTHSHSDLPEVISPRV